MSLPNPGRNAPPNVRPADPVSIKHQIDMAQMQAFSGDHEAATSAAEAHRLKLVELREEAERATAAILELNRVKGL